MLILQRKIFWIMKRNWRSQKIVFWQIVFSIVFYYFFTKNSFLRPSAEPMMECIIALMLISSMAINYWTVYPVFHNKKTAFFYFLSILEIIIITIVEFSITIGNQIAVYSKIANVERKQIFWTLFFNLFYRNGGLICFAGLMAYTTELKIRLFEKDYKLLKLKHQLLVHSLSKSHSSYLLDVDRVCYIQQNQNYSRFITFDGHIFSRRGTLRDVQDLFRSEDFLRISKNTMVRSSSIISCKDNKVSIRMGDAQEPVLLSIGASYAPDVLPFIEHALLSTENNQSETDDAKQDPASSLLVTSSKSMVIYQYITEHPKCKLSDIVKNTKISKSTVARHIQTLQKNGLVRYLGNRRTGGYLISEMVNESFFQ